MTVMQDPVRGCYVISELVDRHLVTRKYYFYTKREAIRLFRNEIKEMKNDTRKSA